MNMSTWIRCVASAGVLLFANWADVGAQAPPSDPWKMLPALPTTCFAEDGFSEKLHAASESIKAEVERQKKVNDEAKKQFDNMDMMEKAQRMQAFMMKNPQAAARMLQAEQATGDAAAAAMPEIEQTAVRLEAERKQLLTSFETAADQAVKPVRTRQEQLIAAKTIGGGQQQAHHRFASAADQAQYVQLVAEENAAYEKACAPYFGTGGSFHKWLSRYRTEVVERALALGQGDFMVTQMEAVGLPGGGYRSTAPLEKVDLYLNQQVRPVFDVRRSKVQPNVEPKR